MLHYKTIDTKTLELLKQLQKIDIFDKLRLVGGTALALQIGHRTSVVDAEKDSMPLMLKPAQWETIKKCIIAKTDTYIKKSII